MRAETHPGGKHRRREGPGNGEEEEGNSGGKEFRYLPATCLNRKDDDQRMQKKETKEKKAV